MKDVDDFLHKYEAQASLSHRKMYAKRRPMSMSQYHRYHTAMDVYEYESYVEREPYVEMYIPQHKFQDLVQRDIHFTKMSKSMDYATHVVQQQAQEEAIRKQNPAVELAYRKYQMLLEMVRT